MREIIYIAFCKDDETYTRIKEIFTSHFFKDKSNKINKTK